MVVLSCLPETKTGSPDERVSVVKKPGAELPNTPRPHFQQQTNGLADDENLPLPPKPAVTAEADAASALNHEVVVSESRWEEVRADGIYVLNVDSSSSDTVEEQQGSSEGVGGASRTKKTTPCAEQLFSWPPAVSCGAVIAEEPRLRPPLPLVDSTRPRDSQQQQQAGCPDGNNPTACGARNEERDERETGKNDAMSRKLFNCSGKSSEDQSSSSSSKRDVSEKETAEPNELESESEGVRRTLPAAAAAGLLAKLRDSIQRRVGTIPYSLAASEAPSKDIKTTAHRLYRNERGNGGTGNGNREVSVGLQGDGEALHPGPQDGDGMRNRADAAEEDARGQGDSGFEHHATAATDDDDDGGGRSGDDDGTFHHLQSDGAPSVSATTAVPATPVATARVGVLFSGGLDSVVLAAMLAEAGGERRPAVPKGEAIDLINVCFDRYNCNTTGQGTPVCLHFIHCVTDVVLQLGQGIPVCIRSTAVCLMSLFLATW